MIIKSINYFFDLIGMYINLMPMAKSKILADQLPTKRRSKSQKHILRKD